jgi:hypothetical protein
MPIGIDMNNYDISMGTGQIRMSGGGNMTMSSSSVTNQGIYYDLSGWTLRSGVLPTTSTWISTEYGDGKFVALANTSTAANQVAYSTDGVSWTGTTGISTLAPRSITYGPDLSGNKYFVVIGDGGTGNRCMTSTNGISWTGKSITSNDTTWRGIANGNGMFVAVAAAGSTAGRIAYTNNPNLSGSWTIPSFDGSNNAWFGVAYGNGTFVAVGATAGTSNQVAYSTNGINWTRSSSTVDTSWYGVVYGNGLFVAGGTPGAASTHIMTSPDGITWTARTSPSAATFLASGSIYTGGLFVSVSNNFDANSRCLISQDGITWTLRNTSVLPSINTVQIAYGVVGGVGRVVATGASTNSVITADIIQTNVSSNLAKNNVFIGNDISMTDGLPAGYNWMQQNQNISSLRAICYGVPTTGIYAGQGLFVAVSVNASPFSNVRTSVDGINWVAQTTDASANQSWGSICFGNGLFVAVSASGTTNSIMTSSDGVNWIVRRSPNTNTLREVAFGNGVFVAVASTGSSRVIKSTDGINWTQISADTYSWYGITYGNNTFVITGDNGYGISTNNGDSWTLGATPVTNEWRAVTYGNGLFVAISRIGTGNRVMTSPNGSTWTIRTSAADNTWTGITYGNGLFVAVSTTGTGNRVMISQDGINWTCRNVPNNDIYANIAYGVISSGIYAGQGIFVSPSFNSSNCIISVPGPQNNIAIGNNTTVDGVNSVAIGYGAKCTASNQVVIGSSTANTSSILLNGSNISTTLDGKLTISQSSECSLTNAPSVSYGQTSTLGFGFAGGISGTAYRWQIKDVTLNRDNGAGPNYDYGAQSKLIFSAKSNNTFSNTTSDRTLIDGLTLVPNSGGNGGLSSGINVGIGTTDPTATLDVSGNVRYRNTPSIYRYATTGQSIPNLADTVVLFSDTTRSGTLTGITYNSTTGIFTNSNSYMVTVTVSYTVSFPTNATGFRAAWIHHSALARFGVMHISPSTDVTILTGTGTFPLNANETFWIYVYQTSGGPLTLVANTTHPVKVTALVM